ncbi:phosphoribosyltransferase [Roseicitreum antarcticum]|uniref:Adenine/guanine phosphoribosyltransferase n=1 Tax=Roseicitreum antarcticum TaxID=564137 RepID=A0A1H2TQ53_9RHOB|nr:phosphoribosyltransferase [Roseicitreum antarcticum]SDW46020.1 Adenine/guanine phosphoribosyltransferase [Roseicitreum antarcticum]
MPAAPHEYWQEIHPSGTFAMPDSGFDAMFPASLPDDRQICLPIRSLPDDPAAGVASLIINQASFAVADALIDGMAEHARVHAPEVIVGVPTLGLGPADGVARRLGHSRMVALGISRKFWYRDELSVDLRSITTPGGGKRLYLDPRMVPLLQGKRVVVIDDVLSSGSSLMAVLDLLALVGVTPVGAVFAMLQGDRWRAPLAGRGGLLALTGAIRTPRLKKVGGGWFPQAAAASADTDATG